INYAFIKSSFDSRPKQLSRLEEEILASAMIWILSKKDLNFYSSQVKKESFNEANEYLYEPYFKGYKNFLEESRKSAKEYQDGIVIRTDIKSYYKNIRQNQLIDITKHELNITSKRILWLLEKILKKPLDQHESDIGLSQKNTSGFYANLYLIQVDRTFQNNKIWKVKYHRYADDIIIVLPNLTYKKDVEAALRDELNRLGLELNESKTEYYDDTASFLETIKNDEKLEELSKEFNLTIYLLWLTNSEYRTKFEFANTSENDNLWWYLISLYQQCLYSINIYITKKDLSRKIYKYLFDQTQRKKAELKLPSFPRKNIYSTISNWATNFEESEKGWLNDKNILKTKIVSLFKDSFKKLKEVEKKLKLNSIDCERKYQLNVERRRLESRIRFTISKLIILGLDEVWQDIVNLICGNLFVIRDVLDVVISLASQGYTDAINQLKECYHNDLNKTSEYLRAVILEALRFLPSLNIQDWELIFETATQGKSDIEKLKATETWLYLGEIAKQFVQDQHIQAVATALNTEPQALNILNKNYILILGMHAPNKIDITKLDKQKDDYLIADAVNLALNEKVSELFEEDEPAIIRQYYSVKEKSEGDEKHRHSL
ncbi:MAG: reverse transcriptase domain-containing protein, partial [Cyanobacteriota bacterium]|nr:reverse transcriptase domain-containing protein [Cyanobacteriota bacterium]